MRIAQFSGAARKQRRDDIRNDSVRRQFELTADAVATAALDASLKYDER